MKQLLIVLMLFEIRHAVPVSNRSHVPVTEPFLVVGLTGSIRCILVLTLEAATLTTEAGRRPKTRDFNRHAFMNGRETIEKTVERECDLRCQSLVRA